MWVGTSDPEGPVGHQPLMAMLRFEQVNGQLQGIETGSGREILEALFADDTGLLLRAEEENWNQAAAVIRKFEIMSGAKLNVQKSLVVPIGFEEPPGWLLRSGCKIPTEGEVWTYLGCPLGVNLTEEQTLQKVLDKITKRLNHWSGKLLSWESRVVLAKHVLQAIPSYVLMVLGLSKDGCQELTKACRKFIWGVNREGVEKKALIAWSKVCRRKEDGGLGLVKFELQGKALKLRFISKVLDGEDLDWVHLFKVLIKWKILDTTSRANEIHDSVEATLLTASRLQLKNMPIMDSLLAGWWHARKHLHFKEGARIPEGTNLETALKCLVEAGAKQGPEVKRTLAICRKIGVSRPEHFSAETLGELQNRDANDGRKVTGGRPSGPISRTTDTICRRILPLGPSEGGIQNPALWEWRRGSKKWEDWNLPTQTWRDLLEDPLDSTVKLNETWGTSWNKDRWKRWWQELWKSEIFLRDKMWFWRCMHEGLCVNKRLQKMGFGDGQCDRYLTERESVAHCILDCEKTKERWNLLSSMLSKAQPDLVPRGSLPEGMEAIFRRDGIRVTYLILLAVHSRTAWRDRCKLRFEGKHALTPLIVVIQEAMTVGKEMEAATVSINKKKSCELALAYLNLIQRQESKDRISRSFNQNRLMQPCESPIQGWVHHETTLEGSAPHEEGIQSSGDSATNLSEDRSSSRRRMSAVDNVIEELSQLGFTLSSFRP
ncbi:hypothetical protein R1sor_019119 [Riccia sorocarpa]|uniref:Reverse transcriptase zinc-binding domain-containing protein n=1 Tax=Riccia sorocarpa TaxID=122646 RepID=A0ABD3IFV6_9MARC